MYFGGIWGGQLQKYRKNIYKEEYKLPPANEPALLPLVAKMTDDLLQFAEDPKEVQILDEFGKLLLAGDNDRRFFEASWVHKYGGKYYFSYSICEVGGKWYLFYHDSSLSKGVTHLRSVKVTELVHRPDGTIETIDPYNNLLPI